MRRFILSAFLSVSAIIGAAAFAQACPAGTHQCVICTGTDGKGHCIETKLGCCFNG
jgi:hypothetical protein